MVQKWDGAPPSDQGKGGPKKSRSQEVKKKSNTSANAESAFAGLIDGVLTPQPKPTARQGEEHDQQEPWQEPWLKPPFEDNRSVEEKRALGNSPEFLAELAKEEAARKAKEATA